MAQHHQLRRQSIRHTCAQRGRAGRPGSLELVGRHYHGRQGQQRAAARQPAGGAAAAGGGRDAAEQGPVAPQRGADVHVRGAAGDGRQDNSRRGGAGRVHHHVGDARVPRDQGGRSDQLGGAPGHRVLRQGVAARRAQPRRVCHGREPRQHGVGGGDGAGRGARHAAPALQQRAARGPQGAQRHAVQRGQRGARAALQGGRLWAGGAHGAHGDAHERHVPGHAHPHGARDPAGGPHVQGC
mmetsp:Transcript_17387/g.43719  ORF Transcript_17387/g.43719 Transcript_17387/m.43719 type:complete len:240 (+) Transcript_17387:381-1100(+)